MGLLLNHRLAKAKQRTNVTTPTYTPQGRLLGAYTTRGEGITQASYRFPQTVQAVHRIAKTRPGIAAEEPYLSAQLGSALSLPIHQDRNNHARTWLIAFGSYSGGRLWIESPLGTQEPPCATQPWQKKLRGEYVDVCGVWFNFDPRLYHALEPVTSGKRISIALFSPKSWRKLPAHSIDELIDIGFFPPFPAQVADAEATVLLEAAAPALPRAAISAVNPAMALPVSVDDEAQGPMPLTISPQDEERKIEEWCSMDHVQLPYQELPSSDGSVQALSPKEQAELDYHLQTGHRNKTNLCRGCLEAEGPRRLHRTIRDVDKATHVLHIDISGPFPTSDDGFSYFLVGALRLPGFPLLIDAKLLSTRTSAEVCDELEKMTSFFESLQFEGFPIPETARIKRLHSDRAGEFTAPYFQRFLSNHKSIHHTLTSGYDPQANGTAERSVGLVKSLAARALSHSGLDGSYWSYAVRYAAQSLLCSALQRPQRSPPFGTTVSAQRLGHRDIKFPFPRAMVGRLLFWDHLQDQLSYILCPPQDENSDPIVYKAGFPVRLPPGTHPEHVIDDTLPQKAFDKPFRETEADKLKEPIDLDQDLDGDRSHDVLYLFGDGNDDLSSSPFTFLSLSSEDGFPNRDNEQTQDNVGNDQAKKQGVSHIPITTEQVLESDGEERFKWLKAGRTELDNLTNTKTVSPISPEKRNELKAQARAEAKRYVELPGKVVFSIKPEKYKVRIVACGNKTSDTFGRISTTDLDVSMLRYILSWSASSPDNSVSTLDVTAAFLNAPLPEGIVVVLRPPTVLYKHQLLPPGYVWVVHKAIYGLREAPSLWSEERSEAMAKIRFRSQGESYKVLLSEVHKSLCLIVKESSLISEPTTDSFGLTARVKPHDVAALSGIYVDDYLSVGPKKLLDDFLQQLRQKWKTSDPLFLKPGEELPFLGVTITMTPLGIVLHQQNYTEAFLEEHASHVPKRSRNTPGEPEHFQKTAPVSPDPSNQEHQEWMKRGQRILGGLLWLSTRTRPDLACAISVTAQVLTKDLEALKVRLRHILQYLNSTRTMGLLYLFPRSKDKKHELTEFTTFSDASFSPSGAHSQSGFTMHLTYGSVRHLVHWQSSREPKIAESSAEAELYALATARKSARNFRLLVHESLSANVTMTLRCDNTAAISMLEEPGWRTRYISIYGESVRQEMIQHSLVLTYVATDRQLADPLTKPTSAQVNQTIYPQWGLVRFPLSS